MARNKAGPPANTYRNRRFATRRSVSTRADPHPGQRRAGAGLPMGRSGPVQGTRAAHRCPHARHTCSSPSHSHTATANGTAATARPMRANGQGNSPTAVHRSTANAAKSSPRRTGTVCAAPQRGHAGAIVCAPGCAGSAGGVSSASDSGSSSGRGSGGAFKSAAARAASCSRTWTFTPPTAKL